MTPRMTECKYKTCRPWTMVEDIPPGTNSSDWGVLVSSPPLRTFDTLDHHPNYSDLIDTTRRAPESLRPAWANAGSLI